MTIPVAGAGLGDQSRVGTPHVATVTRSIFPSGWVDSAIGKNGSVLAEGQSGAAANLSFELEPYNLPAITAVNFAFSGDLFVAEASVGVVTGFGHPALRNRDIAIQVVGVAPPSDIGRARAADTDPSKGANKNFVFEIADIFIPGSGATPVAENQFLFEEAQVPGTDILFGGQSADRWVKAEPYAPAPALNVAFTFGGTGVVTKVGGINSAEVGKPLVDQPLQLLVKGAPSTLAFGNSRVGNYPDVNFAFTDPYTGYSFSFKFGGSDIVAPAPIAPPVTGYPTVRNLAQQVLVQGIAPPELGRDRVADTTLNGMEVDFNFLQDQQFNSSLNVPFYFQWERRAFTDGADSSVFGTATVWNYRSYIYPIGADSSVTFGTTVVENWAEFVVGPSGISSEAFGEPSVAIAPKYFTEIEFDLPMFEVSMTAVYDSLVARPTVNLTHNYHQQANPVEYGRSLAHQVATPTTVGPRTPHRNAWNVQHHVFLDLTNGLEHVEQYRILPHRNGSGLCNQLQDRFDTGDSQYRKHLHTPYRSAELLRYGSDEGFRNAIRLRDPRRLYDQSGDHHELGWAQDYDNALPRELGWESQYQEAVIPLPGKTPIVIPPPPKICYTPSPHLVFKPDTWATELLFYCEGDLRPKPVDPSIIIIPIRKVYITMNEVRVFKLKNNPWDSTALYERDRELNPLSLSLKLDMDSWSWGFDLSLHSKDMPYVWSANPGSPMQFEAIVNGESFILVGERVSRSRAFGKTGVQVSGRGHSAYLSSPYAQGMNFSSTDDSTAQQLMGMVLTNNGVTVNWQVDWEIDDWFVPGGVWSASGSYMDGVGSIMKAAGAFVYSHPSQKKIAIKRRYPVLPWEWAGATPNYVLPADVVDSESISWETFPEYNAVFVSGVSKGVIALVKRSGSAGDVQAPMVTSSLITEEVAARMMGGSVLAQSGKIATVSLKMPVLASTGIIKPGKMVKYSEGGSDVMGLVKGVSVSMSNLTTLRQDLEIEVHG